MCISILAVQVNLFNIKIIFIHKILCNISFLVDLFSFSDDMGWQLRFGFSIGEKNENEKKKGVIHLKSLISPLKYLFN